MIEYLYNAIRAVAGQDETIYAFFANEDGSFICEDCWFMLHDKDGTMLVAIEGECNEETGQWAFELPGEITLGRTGRHWYCFQHSGINMCFREPFYLL